MAERESSAPTHQRHEIATIRDLAELVTEDNIERLATDLLMFLSYATNVKRDCNIIPANFTWLDDGKHNVVVAHCHTQE